MRIACVGVGLAVLALSSEAAAQSWRASVDRLFGFGYSSITSGSVSTTGGVTVTRESTTDVVGFNVLNSGFGVAGVASGNALFAAGQPPRLGFDYELPMHLTFGAAAFFSWSSLSDGDNDEISAVGFGVAPRVGYYLTLGESLAFWPRAGISFAYLGAKLTDSSAPATPTDISVVGLSLNVEPTFVLMASRGFGFTGALVVDVPLVGDVSTSRTVGSTVISTDTTLKQLFVGLQFGVMGRF